jgi:glycosyltransferase involved in cell wall biosynthesis
MSSPELSVVIPTLGRARELERCLDSLGSQGFTNFEVIIVSPQPEDLSRLADKYKGLAISLIEQKAPGLTFARNCALAQAQGRIVSFIDDDVTVAVTWAGEIVNTFAQSRVIGGVSGPTLIPEELRENRDILAFHHTQGKNIFWRLAAKFYASVVLEGSPKAIGRIFKSGAFGLGANYPESKQLPANIKVDYLEACNMSFRKDILDKIGGFSPEYAGIGDWSEPDLSFRVRNAGFSLLFNPRAGVEHWISRGGVFTQRGGDSFQRSRNFIRFYFKWIRPNSPAKLLRFGVNLIFLNLYWCYKFFATRSTAWLGGIRGIFYQLGEELCR